LSIPLKEIVLVTTHACAIGIARARPPGRPCPRPRPAASDCSTPLAFQPIPHLHVHVGFPVDYTARLNRYCSTWSFRKVTAPPEFDLDGAGGLFYWTPAVTGIERITIEATEGN